MLTQDTLTGSVIYLESISVFHKKDLQYAANDKSIWQFMPISAAGSNFHKWFEDCLANQEQGKQITYVVRRKDNNAVLGCTAYYDINLFHQRLALGFSWHIKAVWGTVINPEAKMMMLSQAFDKWGINRVEISTDPNNQRSYQAILALGAKEEGYLREHMINHSGQLTDTVLFSMLKSEWPEIKDKLKKRIEFKQSYQFK
ncbi:GNAT family N-acetyltransferase [Legionella gresilensis]|uniref:GNAT family N-acetyltransferase n=1 Tax=Legionella gresilensis TaxID=91823 RepID=UPI0010418C85|nr:GNAT family protein [Legionella gresilensis]